MKFSEFYNELQDTQKRYVGNSGRSPSERSCDNVTCDVLLVWQWLVDAVVVVLEMAGETKQVWQISNATQIPVVTVFL